MGFPGGKAGAGVYQKIINEIPPHDVYVEPFLGGGAIMRTKRPAALSIGIDLDRPAAEAFAAEFRDADRDAGSSGVGRLDVYHACGIAWLKHAFGLHLVGELLPASPLDLATGSAAARFDGLGPWAWWERLKCFVYCDPPYMRSTRKRRDRLYAHEMTDAQHAELLDVVLRLPCPVAISGYWSSLYAEKLAGWRVIAFNAQTRGGKAGREHLWMNYPAPEELHDYRYLGDDKRQRERVARKRRTWAKGLMRLPAHERQAVLREIDLATAAAENGVARSSRASG